MKVSIITSCYNREATIRGAIESVLEQDYPYLDIILVDDGSPDGCPKTKEYVQQQEILSV